MIKDNTPSGETVREVLSELFYTGSGQPTGDGLTVDDALPRLRQAIEGMVERIIGEASKEEFWNELFPDDKGSGRDVYELENFYREDLKAEQRARAKEELSKLFGKE